MDPVTAIRLAELFEALSDPTRLRILELLVQGEVRVGEVVERIGVSKSAVSHQLRRLRDRRIIRTRKQGRNVHISLDDAHVKELFQRGMDHIEHG